MSPRAEFRRVPYLKGQREKKEGRENVLAQLRMYFMGKKKRRNCFQRKTAVSKALIFRRTQERGLVF